MAKKVLVVDDEKLIVKGIRYSLEQDGMAVEVAYDGRQALEMAQNNAYDVILLDVMLPELNGFEVCQMIRDFSDVPILVMYPGEFDGRHVKLFNRLTPNDYYRAFNVID